MRLTFFTGLALMVFLTACSGGKSTLTDEAPAVSLENVRNLMIFHDAQAVNQSTLNFDVSWAEITQTEVIGTGICVHTEPNPTIRHTCVSAPVLSGRAELQVSGLDSGITYFARPYLTTAYETRYGPMKEIQTDEFSVIRVTSSDLISFARSARSAVLRGIVTGTSPDGIMRRGFVWGSEDRMSQPEETVEIPDGRPFQLPLTNLQFGVDYFFRAFAITEKGTVFGETIRFTFPPYEIGEIGPAGGIIFYYDENNRFPFTFLEAAPAGWGGLSDDIRAEFPCYNQFLEATNYRLGDGRANLQKLLDRCSQSDNNIAKIVAELNIDGYADWFIPSRAELEIMLNTLYVSGQNKAGLSNEFYWSSTEQDDGAAWGIFMGTGNHRLLPKWMQERVRPIRAF
ncbi:DUF1566 domain-containing protein [Cyclonatronum proteinivorum]|nr:DUF1566 domain-containing protein [Cyclonatronum proteinivorum]